MNTKQPEALTLAQKLENAPAWESQSPTIYGWNDSGETLADAAAELRRLHSDYETLRCKQQTLEELCADVQLLRLGYAAARQEIASLTAQPYDQQAMGLCHICGWKGVIDYPDGPVCVACEHDKTLPPQPTAQAQDAQRLTKASKDISTVLRVEGMDLEIGSRKLLKEARESIDAAIAAQQGDAA